MVLPVNWRKRCFIDKDERLKKKQITFTYYLHTPNEINVTRPK